MHLIPTQTAILTLKADIATNDTKIATLQQNLEDAKSKNNAFAAQLQQAALRKEEYERRLAELSFAQAAANDSHASDVDAKTQRIADLETTKSELVAKLAGLTVEYAAATKESEEKYKKLEEAKAGVDTDLEKQGAEVDRLNKEMEANAAKAAQAEEELRRQLADVREDKSRSDIENAKTINDLKSYVHNLELERDKAVADKAAEISQLQKRSQEDAAQAAQAEQELRRQLAAETKSHSDDNGANQVQKKDLDEKAKAWEAKFAALLASTEASRSVQSKLHEDAEARWGTHREELEAKHIADIDRLKTQLEASASASDSLNAIKAQAKQAFA